MKAAILAFTRRGCTTAQRAAAALGGEVRLFTMEKFHQPGFEVYTPPLAEFTDPLFSWADTLVFIGSTGMAVRAIAPWVTDKKSDPGVLVIDEMGTYVISLLSGHIGGANSLTRQLAAALDAQPIITTATDVNHRFSVDDWAARKGLHIADLKAAKAVSAAILEGDVALCCDFPIAGELPQGVVLGNSGKIGIYIGWQNKQPFDVTLQLIPKVLQLGIGCRRNTPKETIEAAVRTVLRGIPMEAVACAASIDLKADEPGLLEFCRSHDLPITFYTAEELRQVPGQFPASKFVSTVTGVDNVCQRSAMLGAEKCIIEKTALDGVTVSLAQKHWEAEF